MARFFKNYMLPFSTVLTVLGVFLTTISWWVAYAPLTFKSLDFYRSILHSVNKSAQGDVNLILMIGAPILLVSAGWYMGEQIVKRRRFEKLFETTKKSDFARNRKDMEEAARDLPDSYRQRIRDREKEIKER